jgi:TonB family protein
MRGKQPVLASDEESATLDALRFSLASDIVELVVLSSDEMFLQTLREAVGGERRLWPVSSAEKVSDLLVAGEVGILVLDAQAQGDASPAFLGQIKRQFPDLVILVAGNREAENSLASLISSGTVYRFIHKPVSPGRAKLFADAAVKKYDERRRRAAATPPPRPKVRLSRRWMMLGMLGTLALAAAAAWLFHQGAENSGAPTRAGPGPPPESPLLAEASAALAANRLTEPPGENALELYLQAQARNPADPQARAGLAEVRERLLAKAENALLEERLDEAAAAIETARKSGVEGGRISFLSAQLAKSRERVKGAQVAARARSESKTDDGKTASVLAIATQRMNEAHLMEPEGDSALFYIQQALQLDPKNPAALAAKTALESRLLTDIHDAIERRDFAHASLWLEAAKGFAAPANIDTAQAALDGARRGADTDAWAQLLKNGTERLQQDRLVEPANDSAKYYLLTLRGLDPGNAGLAPALQDLGNRLVGKARRALTLEQLDAARTWLGEAAAIGFASADAASTQHDLDAAADKQKFMANVIAANDLTLLKSVKPNYPKGAEARKSEGWVELDFTVTPSGAVKDIVVHAASTPGEFDDAAMSALAKWRYQPVLRDSSPIEQRARVRIRFMLTG